MFKPVGKVIYELINAVIHRHAKKDIHFSFPQARKIKMEKEFLFFEEVYSFTFIYLLFLEGVGVNHFSNLQNNQCLYRVIICTCIFR